MILYPDSQNHYPEVFQRYKELSDEFSLEEYEKGDYEVKLIYIKSRVSDNIYIKDKIEYADSDVSLMSIADFYKIYSERFLIPVTDDKIDGILNLLSASMSSPASKTILKQLSYTYDLLGNEKFRVFMFDVELGFYYSELNKQFFQFRELLTELYKFNYYGHRNS